MTPRSGHRAQRPPAGVEVRKRNAKRHATRRGATITLSAQMMKNEIVDATTGRNAGKVLTFERPSTMIKL